MKKNNEAVVMSIQLKDITPSAENPRKNINAAELAELAASIKENGLLQPITVRERDGKYEIVCGERRWRAMQLTGADAIDCIVKDLDDKAALAAMVIENMQRNDVDPMDEASAIGRLVEVHGSTVAEVAKMLGKSETFVWGRIRLGSTIDEFVTLMRNGALVLTHLLEISRLSAEQQHLLYDACFTDECRARWTKQWPNMQELAAMIDEHVTMKLAKARFSLTDASFEGCPACSACSLNDGGVRCMGRDCFLCKQTSQVLRDARAQESGTEVVYAGTEQENEAVISAAVKAGVTLSPLAGRKYVTAPTEPDKEKYTDEEYYNKRVATYTHQKAIFDIGLRDGVIVPVYEVSYNGHLSGERKYVYSGRDAGTEDGQKRCEQVMKLKARIADLDDKMHADMVLAMRQELSASEYGRNNGIFSGEETFILTSVLLKHLSYEFKQRLGLEWSNDPSFFPDSREVMEKHRNEIKRQFICDALSDRSVDYSRDLQGLLFTLMEKRMPAVKGRIEKEVCERYAALKEKLQAQAEALTEQ